MGHVRSHGCRDLLVYCVSPWCRHSAEGERRLAARRHRAVRLEPRMVCTACGLVGADVRPDRSLHAGVGGMGGAQS
jgi:hypothetical protein